MRHHLRHLRADLVTVNPASRTRWVAGRATISVLLPLLLLVAIDHLEAGLFVCFGAFAAVYGGSTPYAGRYRRQFAGGAVLVSSTVIGTIVGLSDHRAWLAVPVTATLAAGHARISDRYRWVPPGPLFSVFACGACASHPTSPIDVPLALGIASATAGFAIGLGRIEEARARIPREQGHGMSRFPLAPHRYSLHIGRVFVAVAVSGGIATAIGIGHPYWAMVSAVVPLSLPRLRAQVNRGLQRFVGTVAGLGLAAIVLNLPLSAVAVVLIAGVLQMLTELLVTRNYAAALIFITPLALVMGHLAAPTPPSELLFDRLVETALGVFVGIVTAIVTRERPRAPVAT